MLDSSLAEPEQLQSLLTAFFRLPAQLSAAEAASTARMLLHRLLTSVLSSAACARLLRRLAHLQAAADALDVEAIHPIHQQLLRQPSSSSLRTEQDEHQQDDDVVDEDTAVQALSRRLLSRPPPLPALQCLHQTAEQARVAIGADAAAAAGGQVEVVADATGASSLSLSESQRAQAVRDYLIAHSLKDCSICVNVITTDRDETERCQTQEETAADCGSSSWYGQSHGWRLSDSLHGLYRLHVLDLELKPAAAIADHCRLDADIVRHYLQLTGTRPLSL